LTDNLIVKTYPRKVALVHDWFSSKFSGGAEKALEIINKVLVENYSTPDLYSLIADTKTNKYDWLYKKKINTSFINNLPFKKNHFHKYFPLFPLAIEEFNLENYKLVVSSSHAVAKGVLTNPEQLHLSYVHTPMRYAWDQMNTYLKSSILCKMGLGPGVRLIMHNLRSWDTTSSMRIDKLCTNSNFTSRRIKKYWGRESKVIYGPVDVNKFDFNKNRSDYYLSVCRLVPNKRVDLLVKAFNKLGYPLIIVGNGPEKEKIKRLAEPNIKIMGYVNNIKVKELMEGCRAFVYAGIEDFGITPVEAMAAGSPVIALGKGGLLDTVKCMTKEKNIKTGILFNEQNVQNIYDAVSWFQDNKAWKDLSPEDINNWSKKFSKEKFYKNFENFLNESLEEFNM